MLARDAKAALPARAIPLALAGSTLVVSLVIAFTGSTGVDDAMLYVWMALYASCSLSWRAAQRAADEEREKLLETLRTAAFTDDLTGLPNRRAWEKQFRREVANASRDGSKLCVAMLDLDWFKEYNDRHGHRAGDELLVEAARAWSHHLRAGELLARHGGEEFALLLRGYDPLEAANLVERIREATPSARTVSAGLATWDGEETADQLLDRADSALYYAKARGRNRAVLAGDGLALAAAV